MLLIAQLIVRIAAFHSAAGSASFDGTPDVGAAKMALWLPPRPVYLPRFTPATFPRRFIVALSRKFTPLTQCGFPPSRVGGAHADGRPPAQASVSRDDHRAITEVLLGKDKSHARALRLSIDEAYFAFRWHLAVSLHDAADGFLHRRQSPSPSIINMSWH